MSEACRHLKNKDWKFSARLRRIASVTEAAELKRIRARVCDAGSGR
jgi:hypothetical protein